MSAATRMIYYGSCHWGYGLDSLCQKLRCNDGRTGTSAHFHQATCSHFSAFILKFPYRLSFFPDKDHYKVEINFLSPECLLIPHYNHLSMDIVFLSFPLGSFSLCFRKHLSLMAYCTIPVLDFPTFSTSSALPRPLSREGWSCKPVI